MVVHCKHYFSNAQSVKLKTKLRMATCIRRTGGVLNVLSGKGARPGFPKCGTCELIFASERGVL